MRTTRIFCTSIVLILFSLMTLAQPRLTVVVVVDGMTQENLNSLRPHWSNGGLYKLMEEAYQTTAVFKHQVYGGQETMATLMTGTTPNNHGIMADNYYDRSNNLYPIQSILHDDKNDGIGTSLHLSPRSITSTTITDEWRMAYGVNSKIYAVGLQPEATILMAGHGANACCWIDDIHLKWATTNFYPEGLPTAADNMNVRQSVNSILSNEWKPSMNIESYPLPLTSQIRIPFSYSLDKVFFNSPASNSQVIDLALELQASHQLGNDHTPDLLVLQLNTISPNAESDMITTIEQTDLYLGINKDLGRLFTELNQRIGRDNYQMLVVGRPIKGYSLETMRMANIPIKHFNTDRVAALVGAYLIAAYGHEKWVLGAHGPFVYLNRLLIEKKGLSLEAIQRQVANFIMEFEGMKIAYPIHDAVLSDEKISVYRRHAGDVYFKLQDNWILDSDESTTFDHVIQQEPIIPVLFWSHSTKYFPDHKINATEIKSLISPME